MKRLLTEKQRREFIDTYGKDNPWVRENVLGLPPLPEPEFFVRRDGTVIRRKPKAKR